MNRREFIEWASIIETTACIIWPFGVNLHGYGSVTLDGVTMNAHRAVLVLSRGPHPDGKPIAAHGECHNRRCVNHRHVRWASHQENSDDKKRDGTTQHGERNPYVKLTDQQVAEIRAKYDGSWGQQRRLALEYGVTNGMIHVIVQNKGRTSGTPVPLGPTPPPRPSRSKAARGGN